MQVRLQLLGMTQTHDVASKESSTELLDAGMTHAAAPATEGQVECSQCVCQDTPFPCLILLSMSLAAKLTLSFRPLRSCSLRFLTALSAV